MTNPIRQNLFSLLILAVTGGVLYAKTLHVPWIFDDVQNIVENPLVRDPGLALSRIGEARGVAFLSFALNYYFGGLDLTGFHLVNIAIHITTSLVVFLIMRRIFRESFLLPLAGALIFLAHPLQTQAVNYIVQRMAGLCGLFFFLSIYFYMCARESFDREGRWITPSHLACYSLSLLSCGLALWTKQNSVVLPLALLMIDRYFMGNKWEWKRLLVYLLPFVMLTAFNVHQQTVGGKIVLKEAGKAEYWAKAKETSATAKIAPNVVKIEKPPENVQLIYLATELSVLWLYIRLLFLPYDQVFDYGYPLTGSIFSLQNLAALSGHLLVAAAAIYLRNRRPLLSFGIFWFYLSLAVESSIIPLDAAVEHRLYMTIFGFALIVLDLIRMIPRRNLAVASVSLVAAVLALLTWQRNCLWADTIAFAKDNLAKAPYNQRNYLTLANAYAEKGLWVEAERTLRAAIKFRPDYPVPYENLGSALAQQGRLVESLFYYQLALQLVPENPNILYNAGVVLIRMGDIPYARTVTERLKAVNGPLASRLESQMALQELKNKNRLTQNAGRKREFKQIQ